MGKQETFLRIYILEYHIIQPLWIMFSIFIVGNLVNWSSCIFLACGRNVNNRQVGWLKRHCAPISFHEAGTVGKPYPKYIWSFCRQVEIIQHTVAFNPLHKLCIHHKAPLPTVQFPTDYSMHPDFQHCTPCTLLSLAHSNTFGKFSHPNFCSP